MEDKSILGVQSGGKRKRRQDSDLASTTSTVVILTVILVTAFAARLYRLDAGLWVDEITTYITYARMPFGQIVSSYQSVSGTGQAAVTELLEQTAGLLAGDEPEPAVYPHPIAFNVLPHIGDFGPDGSTGEEQKVADETRKLLGLPELRVGATCVRVGSAIFGSRG